MISSLFIAALAAITSVAATEKAPLVDLDAIVAAQVNPLLNVVGVVNAEVLRARGIDLDAVVDATVGKVAQVGALVDAEVLRARGLLDAEALAIVDTKPVDAVLYANAHVAKRNLALVEAVSADVAHVAQVDEFGILQVVKRDANVAADVLVAVDGVLDINIELCLTIVAKIEAVLALNIDIDAELELELKPLLDELVGAVGTTAGQLLSLASPAKTRRSAFRKRQLPTDKQVAEKTAKLINTVIAALNKVEGLTHKLNLPLVSALLDDVYIALNPLLGKLLAAVGQLVAGVLSLVKALLGDIDVVLHGLPILGSLFSNSPLVNVLSAALRS